MSLEIIPSNNSNKHFPIKRLFDLAKIDLTLQTGQTHKSIQVLNKILGYIKIAVNIDK